MSADAKEATSGHDAHDALGALLDSAVLDGEAGPALAKPSRELRDQALTLIARDATLRARRRLGLCAIGIATAIVLGFTAPAIFRGSHDGPPKAVTPVVTAPERQSVKESSGLDSAERAPTAVDVSTLPTAPVVERPRRAETTTTKEPKRAPVGTPMPSSSEAEDLLRTANRLRGEKRWDEAMQTYERVIREHPDSDPAYAAMIAAAALRLSRAGDAREALRLYGRALELHPTGELAEEALWGTCTSYRALGQRAEEREALQRFTTRYPSSWRAPEAAERLSQVDERPR